MAHEDKGKFYAKHPEGTKVDDTLKQEILKATKDNNIACKAAEKIAGALKMGIGDVGVGIDMLNINIVQCQLGLFGFDRESKRVAPAPSVAAELEAAIRKALVKDRLACASAWAIADAFQMKRIDVCAACENLKIKVKPCQLGAF